jgi:hypothetical protein
MPRSPWFVAAVLTSALSAAGADPAPDPAPSFLRVVEPVLTRAGCNQGACHGKGAGQNGFRLSLRGYAPELDHHWIVREFVGRRVALSAPEESLLLTKPVGKVPHGGGVLFDENSRDYQTLLAWLKAGAPGPDPKEPALRALHLSAPKTTLRPGEQMQLSLTAEFSDGSRRDVTWLTKFESNDPGLADSDVHGHIKALRHGQTAVRAAYLDQVAVVVLAIPHERGAAPTVKPNNFVDEHVFRKLAELKIPASDLSGDAEFLRRAFLDTIGVLPTPDEARAFLADTRPDKRSRLIDSLLARPEFDDFWALQLADLLQNRRERDHDVRGAKGVRAFHDWIRAQVAAGRPWDALARDVLTASGDSVVNPAVGYFVVTVGEHREAHKSEVVASVAQAFLGTRIGCARCHNHPLERYTQDDYYHFAGFFSRLKLKRQDPRKGPTELLAVEPGKPLKKGEKTPAVRIGVNQPRTGKFLAPRPLDRVDMTFEADDDPRVKLAAWMTDPSNEYFSGNMVNRLWRHFMGSGLVEPVDDLRATNPPANPELWKALNAEFVSHKFDLRHLMRVILNSAAYQLSSATKPGNEADTRFASHYSARRLPAEVLADALSAATGVPDVFPGQPVGLRAVQLPDPKTKSYFLSLFGRSERVTACACERSGDITMAQLLHIQNGDSVVRKIAAADGRLSAMLAARKPDAEIIEELFLAALTRRPTLEETAAVQKAMSGGDPRDDVLRDLFWALLNSKEFSFNH